MNFRLIRMLSWVSCDIVFGGWRYQLSCRPSKFRSVTVDLFLTCSFSIQEEACSQMCVDPNSEICLAANFFKVWKCCFWHRYIKLQQKNRLELLLQVAGQATVYPLIATCTLIDSCFYGHHINPFYLCLYVRANGQYNILWQATWTVVCPPVVYGAFLTFKSTVEKWNSIKGNTVCSSSILQLHSCFDYVTAPTAKWAQPQACWGLGLTSVLEGLMKTLTCNQTVTHSPELPS